MTSSNSQMHNDIMAVGSKEHPLMLAPGSYAQWKSRFMRHVDTKLNRELLRKCIYEGLYEMNEVQLEDTPSDAENPRQPGQMLKETYANTSLEKRKLSDAEVEAVYMILNGIGNDIYSILDACPNAKYVDWNKNVDTFPKTGNERHTGQFGNQRTITVAGKGETVGNQVVQQSWIQCFNYKGFGHFSKECRSANRVNFKEKMLLCKKEAARIQLRAKQSELLQDTYDEPDEQELEAHYMYMEKIQEVLL
ncbi:hypothetical protein Tco_1166357 [Tanacetum coccineum]